MFKAALASCVFMFCLCFTATASAQNGLHQHNGRWHGHPHNAFHRHFPSQRVAYHPIIRWYPQGTFLNVGPALVSPDRRYVRMGMNIGFSSITGYHTFNYGTGRSRWYPSKK